MGLPKRLIQQLEKRKNSDNLRSLKTVEGLIDFSSNDYLGLSQNKELHGQYTTSQTKSGSTGSRLLSGNNESAMECERFLADIFNAEKSLILNSGYNSNLAILSAIPQRGDLILYDELVHASIKDGMRLSLAEKQSFKHNDLDDLRKKLQKQEKIKYIVAESIYSMDGDEAPLNELVKLCQEYNALLVLDEAHATGVYGKNGGGLSEQLGLTEHIFCRIHTFGKGIGLHGASISGQNEMIDYLINFARPFIYTTALPPSEYEKIKIHFEYIRSNSFIQKQLHDVINFYLRSIDNLGYKTTESRSAIQTVVIPGNSAVKKAAEIMKQNGLDVRAICSPTVKEGQERLRICLHSFNTHDEISKLVTSLASV